MVEGYRNRRGSICLHGKAALLLLDGSEHTAAVRTNDGRSERKRE